MTNQNSRAFKSTDWQHAATESALEDQARAHFLVACQLQRGDTVLVDLLAQYGLKPRPAPGHDVILDFSLMTELCRLCTHREQAAWTALLIGTAIRGDREGQSLVETMVRHRLSA